MSTSQISARGPEVWDQRAGGIWSWWDLWFCVVTVMDHGGNFDALEAHLVAELRDHRGGREGTEARLSHLAGLRERMAAAGFTLGDLASPEVLSQKGLLARARKKVAERYPQRSVMTPAMLETPRVRLDRRSRTGRWSAFPVDPARFYDPFRSLVEVDFITERRSLRHVDRVEKRLASLDKPRLTEAERLALYRAFHTAGLVLTDRADDSFGVIGELRQEAWHTYLALDWAATGMAPADYWADLCDLVVMEAYGLEYREETLPWSRLPAAHAELVEGLLVSVEAECRGHHLDYFADHALQNLAWLALARRRFGSYVAVAARLGANHIGAVQALAESALGSKRGQLAIEVFREADQPGHHRDLLRQRCLSLTGVDLARSEDTIRSRRCGL